MAENVSFALSKQQQASNTDLLAVRTTSLLYITSKSATAPLEEDLMAAGIECLGTFLLENDRAAGAGKDLNEKKVPGSPFSNCVCSSF